MSEDKQGTVYVVQQGTDPLFKIGYTEKEVKDRISSLQIGNPSPLRLVGTIVVEGPEHETALHDIYDPYRVRGEWFRLPLGIVLEVLEIGSLPIREETQLEFEKRETERKEAVRFCNFLESVLEDRGHDPARTRTIIPSPDLLSLSERFFGCALNYRNMWGKLRLLLEEDVLSCCRRKKGSPCRGLSWFGRDRDPGANYVEF